jgi:hypothetical protein
MAWWRVVGGLAILGILGLAGVDTEAQEVTPTTAPPGVVREPLPGATVSQVSGNIASLQLERWQFPPGAALTLAADEAPIVVLVIEAGALDVRSPAPLTIQRGGAAAEIALTETIPPQTGVTLRTGDRLVTLTANGLQLRNLSDQPARILHVGVVLESSSPLATAPQPSGGLVLALAVVEPPHCPPGTEPGSPPLAATPNAGGGGGGAGGVAIAFAAAPACVEIGATPAP